MEYKIALIRGDGIGPEVIDEGVKVLKEVARLDGRFDFSFTYFPWGCEFYKETGKMILLSYVTFIFSSISSFACLEVDIT